MSSTQRIPQSLTFTDRALPEKHDQAWSIPAIGALAASAIVLTVLMRRAGLTIDPYSHSNIPYLAAGLFALALRVTSASLPWRHARAIGACAEYYALFTFMALMGAVASYPLSGLTHGYHDAALQRVDDALRFDWLACYRTVAAHPTLQVAGIVAYRSIYLTPAVLLGYFAATGRRAEAYRFLALFWLTAVVTLALFSLMPAVGPFSYLWHGPIPYMPDSELWQPDLIPQLRDHGVRVVDLGQLRGLVSAPSFHAAAATLYVATAWPIARLRWPLLWVNAAMLVSTPVEGTHYLADIILGIAVAACAILTFTAVARRVPG